MLLYEEKVSQSFIDKVIDIARRLDVDPNWIMSAIDFESGHTFSASVTNKIGCVGLIQFCPDAGQTYKTIAGERIELSALASMTNVEQLEWVYKYLNQYKSKLISFADLYLAIFYPRALAKPDDYVLQDSRLSADTIARNNPAFALVDPDTGQEYVTVRSVKDTILSTLPDGFMPMFQKTADSITKYATRNWLGISITAILLTGSIIGLIRYRKSLIKVASQIKP